MFGRFRVKSIYIGDENNEAVEVWNKEKGWINKELYIRAHEKQRLTERDDVNDCGTDDT